MDSETRYGQEQDEDIDLGPCCTCGECKGVHNILLLEKKAPISGRGWGRGR